MKLKKIMAVLLVAVMLSAFGITASAETINFYSSAASHSPLDATKTEVGLYLNMEEEFNAIQVACPNYGNNIGTLIFSLYLWDGDYASSVAADALASQSFVDYKDNANNKFEFPTAPAGEYLLVIKSGGSDQVGIWFMNNISDYAKAAGATMYYGGQVKDGMVHGCIITGKSATLGNLAISTNGETPIDIGTDLKSNIPAKSFEEKIAESIIMYTGSNKALVGNEEKMIDKYNKNVTPIVVETAEGGCTLLPIRFTAETLGTALTWDDENEIITMDRYGVHIEMKVGSKYMKLNGEVRELQVAPVIIEGRTMVPLRAVSEALNYPIHWRQDGKNGLIILGETCNDLGEDLTVIGTLLSKLKIK